MPKCWESDVRLRPDLTRAVRVSCTGATGAKLTTPPAHSDVSNVSADWYGLHFDARPHDGAPRLDEAVFEIKGYEGSIEKRVSIEVVPASENSPPICEGDRVTERSDGTGPVDVFLHPWCRDPDGDDFVIHGGPPGVHRGSPKAVPAGESDSNWDYRTATFSGDETTTIWATDVLGARSADARLEITVGPGVDRPPKCRPSSYSGGEVSWIRSRPGMTRRFAVICEDPDADPFTASLSSPPERGVLALFEQGDLQHGYWGAERWIDVTYVPRDDSLELDPFSVTASGAGGAGPAARMAIAPQAPSENGGGGCGWSPTEVISSVPGSLRLNCSDEEGDSFSADILTEPRHGTATPAVITPARYGSSDITIPYVPDPGYEGYDCVKIRVTDAHGLSFDMTLDIWVRQAPPPVMTPPPPPLPPLYSPPPLASPPPLSFPSPATGTTPEPVRTMAQRILGTPSVKRVPTAGGAEVFARTKLSRRDLMRNGQAPSLVAVCTTRCRIRGDAELATGVRSLRSRPREMVAAVTPGQPHVLALTLGTAERRALLRARNARAKFRLSIRAARARPTSLKRSIPVSR